MVIEPIATVAVDESPDDVGVQTSVRVRTTVGAGAEVVLEVADADGDLVTTVTATTDQAGDVTFTGVTVPQGTATLRAHIDAGSCGHADDELSIAVTAGMGCAISLRPAPLASDYYAPLGVLNAAIDPSADPGFQSDLMVLTAPSWQVTLFVGSTGGEVSSQTAANDDGVATLAQTLPEGRVSLRAVCTAPNGLNQIASLSMPVIVDTEAPGCALISPTPGSTITPGLDGDGDLGNGLQLTAIAQTSGGDTADVAATFELSGDGGAGTSTAIVDGSGVASAAITVAPPSTPASFQVRFSASDHAGNSCAVTQAYLVVYQGCDLTLAATSPPTVDVDGDPSNGSQIDVSLAVSTGCAGQTVSSDCGVGNPGAVVTAEGDAVVRVTACLTSPCEADELCTFRVNNEAGVETTLGHPLRFDDLAPAATVAVVAPALGCGASVTAAVDQSPSTAGVQVLARVTAVGAATLELEVANAGGTSMVSASSDVMVTLAPGGNALVGIASDGVGNVGRSATCAITLSDIAVSFAAPAADGVVGAGDGAVAGDQLTFPLCGTVSRTGASVSVTLDGGAPLAATVVGTSWCRTLVVAETPPAHTIVTTATAGASTGSATLILTVDLTPPGTISDFVAATRDRQSIDVSWRAPGDGAVAYRFKVSTTALTESNFDATGTEVDVGAVAAPGSLEARRIAPLHAGVAWWVGVAAQDDNGNRSPAWIAGPLTPLFDQTGAILPPATVGNAGFGTAMARGLFNDDALFDLAIAAPGENTVGGGSGAVYVYFGGATGIPATPDVVIAGPSAGARFGSGLAAGRFSSATRDDLFIGAPGVQGGAGRVYVFTGGTLVAGGYSAGDADDQVMVHPSSPGWFNGSGLGADLAVLDLDGDGDDDLAMAAPTGGNLRGGIAVIYGGTASGAVVLSDVDGSGLADAVVDLIEEPSGVAGRQFGRYLHNVGSLGGSGDASDDLLIGYADDYNTVDESCYVFRGRSRPMASGVHRRDFTIGVDTRIVMVTSSRITELASQATSIGDLDGDGDREIVLGAYRALSNTGQVFLIDGGALGASGVATTTDAGVLIAVINGNTNSRLGAAIVDNVTGVDPDVDGDGVEDLLISGGISGAPRLNVWFGDLIPTGSTTVATVDHVVTGPSPFASFATPPGGGAGGQAMWLGDVNGDGLDDLCWAAPADNQRDGVVEVLWDQR